MMNPEQCGEWLENFRRESNTHGPRGCDMRPLRAEIVKVLSQLALGSRVPVTVESQMQAHLDRVFRIALGPGNVAREVAIERGRIDFLLTIGRERIGVECKTKGTFDELLRQTSRYLEPDGVDALLIVTSRITHRDMPPALHGKPIAVAWVGLASL